jgi:pimeloyl-ACP methyl ester carboxylesterase
LALSVQPGEAQRVVERYADVGGFLRIGSEPERRVPMTERGSTLLLPEDAASIVQGVTVFIDSRRFRSSPPRLEPRSFDAEALRRSLAVLHITTGNPLDFLFEVGEVQELADRIGAVLRQADLEDVPVFLAGLSLGGTRALRLAAFLGANPAGARFRVAGVAIVDAPLDMARLWETERRAANLGFHPTAADEGRWVTYLLETHLGGAPRTSSTQYAEFSPFSHGTPGGGNAVYLRDTPIRAYHEPDIDWWIENRRKSYYDMNSIDLAELINQLRILGNESAELISSHRRRAGYAEGATPHTWSIVDNQALVEWFLSHAPPAARPPASHRPLEDLS